MAFHLQPRQQTTAPATASRMKWLAVEMMAMRITVGYKTPKKTQIMRRIDGSLIFGARLGWERLKNGSIKVLERRCWGGRGIDMMVRPIMRE